MKVFIHFYRNKFQSPVGRKHCNCKFYGFFDYIFPRQQFVKTCRTKSVYIAQRCHQEKGLTLKIRSLLFFHLKLVTEEYFVIYFKTESKMFILHLFTLSCLLEIKGKTSRWRLVNLVYSGYNHSIYFYYIFPFDRPQFSRDVYTE